MLSVSVATTRQFVPSVETDAVIVDPARESFTQYGAVKRPPDVLVEMSFVLTRRWSARPLFGFAATSMNACREPGSSVSRIITPAFVQLATNWTLVTLETIDPSPLRVV